MLINGILVVAAAVCLVFYLLRRRARLKAED
jgi:hypothetical protein